jgi:aminoglycoside 6-adenylyltransferase
MANGGEAAVLRRIVAWAEADDDVRALVLTSSRARGDETVDRLSDYDVVAAVRDAEGFVAGERWRTAYGVPAASWGDASSVHGERSWFRGVVHTDGVKIDWTFWPETVLERVAVSSPLPSALDVGYRVLLDKTGLTERWPPPTGRAHIPEPPTEAEYRAVVEEFWWGATYVAKSLHREEVFFAKFVLGSDLTFGPVRRMLEWRLELDHDWALRPGSHGRGLERLLPPTTWDELAATFVGTGVDENWEALDRLAALFRRTAREVGASLGYEYPERTDEAVVSHLARVREA